ncbi:hypothetical protein EPUS_04286 [Endocarpon pusillum Z07020]|uniref:DUF7779 domain-containing protein n=1 Tax=Endocarpon pusillum (strain Z07020 / HMAS-L-300199) TaxID=1263415 RepID=U1GLS0_ENDPU|nr:uncharacterized protein EPUS_04286 [Endocarpon pusillum Z07020]ERF72851.1 hypothetical protein EPUS_04286 [Endocarpon pusillum Z07020]
MASPFLKPKICARGCDSRGAGQMAFQGWRFSGAGATCSTVERELAKRMGKTQVAAQFVATHRNEFDAIFWVHADDVSKLSQDFKTIAINLGLISEDSVDANDLVFIREIVKRWLVTPLKDLSDDPKGEPTKATWLLVFDGVEDPDVLNDFWPYDGPGSVPITSRSPFSWTTSLPLKPFTSDEATEFLLKITRREASEEARKEVIEIIRRLGCIPLALSQMAGVILHKQLSFSEFLDSYNERRSQQELLQLSAGELISRSSDYEHTLASVWAFDNLSHGQGLLNVISMLDPDGILESILTTKPGTIDLPSFPQSLEDYLLARNELLTCSLVRGNSSERKLSIHRLVQDVARARMTQAEFRANFMTCVKLISSMWPFEPFAWRRSIARWTMCEDLVPHVFRLKDLFPQVAPSPAFSDDDYRFAKLLTDAGWYNHERGRSSDSDLFNSMAKDICESLKARLYEQPEAMSSKAAIHKQLDSILAEIQHNRGCIATETNAPYDALAYHKEFNAMMVRDMGTDVPSNDMRLAISWNELGNAYMLNRFEKVSISLPLANLGLAYWLQGRHEEANDILVEGLKDRVDRYGPDDRISFVTGRFLHALGNVKASQKAMNDSLAYHHKALLHYKSTLGNNHHRTADTFVKVAEHHMRLRQNETAMALLDHALQAYSSSSSSHAYLPEKARASFKRSCTLRSLGRIDEADAELQISFEDYKKLLGRKLRRSGGDDGGSNGTDIPTAAGVSPRQRKEDLTDQDFDDMIVFWSK